MLRIITQTIQKIKGQIESFLNSYQEEVGVSLIIVLVAISSFYLGKLSSGMSQIHPPISIEEPESAPQTINAANLPDMQDKSLQEGGGQVVATLNGKRWYMPWCPTVSKLAPSAKRYFASVAAAEAAGLTPAQNCAGMKKD